MSNERAEKDGYILKGVRNNKVLYNEDDQSIFVSLSLSLSLSIFFSLIASNFVSFAFVIIENCAKKISLPISIFDS